MELLDKRTNFRRQDRQDVIVSLPDLSFDGLFRVVHHLGDSQPKDFCRSVQSLFKQFASDLLEIGARLMSVFFPVASSIIYDLSLVEVHIELLVCGVIRQ